MRYAIIADVHSNLEALNAVLEELRYKTADSILFLGDSVGYGPNPNECIEILRENASVLIAGNHDRAAIGLTDIEYFNPNARAAIEWTKTVLSDENKVFLEKLPITQIIEHADSFLVHSTPKEPEQWHYLMDTQDAYVNFQFFTEKICCIGHSHQPVIIEQLPGGELVVYRDRAEIKDEHRYIINAGSVGQPRDGNPEACYAIINENSVEIKRVSYDILSTQKKMRETGLPSFLIERLARGF